MQMGAGLYRAMMGVCFLSFPPAMWGRAFSGAYSICWPRGQIGIVGYWASLESAFWR